MKSPRDVQSSLAEGALDPISNRSNVSAAVMENGAQIRSRSSIGESSETVPSSTASSIVARLRKLKDSKAELEALGRKKERLAMSKVVAEKVLESRRQVAELQDDVLKQEAVVRSLIDEAMSIEDETKAIRALRKEQASLDRRRSPKRSTPGIGSPNKRDGRTRPASASPVLSDYSMSKRSPTPSVSSMHSPYVEKQSVDAPSIVEEIFDVPGSQDESVAEEIPEARSGSDNGTGSSLKESLQESPKSDGAMSSVQEEVFDEALLSPPELQDHRDYSDTFDLHHDEHAPAIAAAPADETDDDEDLANGERLRALLTEVAAKKARAVELQRLRDERIRKKKELRRHREEALQKQLKSLEAFIAKTEKEINEADDESQLSSLSSILAPPPVAEPRRQQALQPAAPVAAAAATENASETKLSEVSYSLDFDADAKSFSTDSLPQKSSADVASARGSAPSDGFSKATPSAIRNDDALRLSPPAGAFIVDEDVPEFILA
ncbi:hypothetical protein HK405_013335, partial [Cladochytrium tenue]